MTVDQTVEVPGGTRATARAIWYTDPRCGSETAMVWKLKEFWVLDHPKLSLEHRKAVELQLLPPATSQQKVL